IDFYTLKGDQTIDLKSSFEYQFVIVKEEEEEKEIIKRDVKKIIRRFCEINTNIIDSQYKKVLKYCVPRPEKKLNIHIKPRTPWIFGISVWYYYEYAYEGDNEDYLDKCFEHDFD